LGEEKENKPGGVRNEENQKGVEWGEERLNVRNPSSHGQNMLNFFARRRMGPRRVVSQGEEDDI